MAKKKIAKPAKAVKKIPPKSPGKLLRGSASPQARIHKPTALTPSGRKDQSFFELVHEVARQIPKGRVTSYGAIAACLGTRLSARMVGWAMNGAHHAKPKVPAHRVVNRNGMLSGKAHFETPTKMEELLAKEGIEVVDDIIVNFQEKFWDPASMI
jgi:methylated-DNA-protein-cysteine methyltransferase-like protein